MILYLKFQKKHIRIEPNSPQEIREAAEECYAIINGQFRMSDEDKELCDRFRELPDPTMPLLYHSNRPSMAMLRRMKSEL